MRLLSIMPRKTRMFGIEIWENRSRVCAMYSFEFILCIYLRNSYTYYIKAVAQFNSILLLPIHV